MQTLSYTAINNIIDSEVMAGKDFSIICDGHLANHIKEYIDESYDMNNDYCDSVIKEDDVYIVECVHGDVVYNDMLCLENIKTTNGFYKEIECYGNCYIQYEAGIQFPKGNIEAKDIVYFNALPMI